MPKFFISYRRQDSAYPAHSICGALEAQFGPDSVVFDVDTIPLGVDFKQYLNRAVSDCDALLAIIGDQWLESQRDDGTRRLSNPDDLVRIEIESAFQRSIPVIPVLVGRARIPNEDDLPDSLKRLVRCNAADVRSGGSFRTDLDRLVERLACLVREIDESKVRKRNHDLEESLLPFVALHGVRRLRVVGDDTTTVGGLAADYFASNARNGDVVVIDGGRTVRSFVDAVTPIPFDRTTIVPMCADPPSYEASSYEAMTLMADRLQSHCEKLPFHRGAILSDAYSRVRAVAQQARFVFIGFGPWTTEFMALSLAAQLGLEPEAFRSQYPEVAATSAYFALDQNSRLLQLPELEARLPRSLMFDEMQALALKESCHVVLIGSGEAKVKALDIVLRAKICNTLIIDDVLAQSLLTKAQSV